MTHINYDKYEGHYKERLAVASRKGSWDWVIYFADDPNQEVCQMTHDGIDEFNEVGEATAHLFADSPLILQRCMELEAVLKLRYELEGVLSDYEHDKSFGEIGYNTVKRVAQALSNTDVREGE